MNFLIDKLPDLLINLLASAIAVIAVLGVERTKRPKIAIQPESHPPIAPDKAGPQRKFLRVLVHNKPIHPFLGFFYTREPALTCQAWITFLHDDNSLVFSKGHRMKGRWSRTNEPVTLNFTETSIIKVRDLRFITDT